MAKHGQDGVSEQFVVFSVDEAERAGCEHACIVRIDCITPSKRDCVCRMPGLDGCATARHLQAEPELADIRRIAATAFTDERSGPRAWEAEVAQIGQLTIPLNAPRT